MTQMMVEVRVVESYWYVVSAANVKDAVTQGIAAYQDPDDEVCITSNTTDMEVKVNGKLIEP